MAVFYIVTVTVLLLSASDGFLFNKRFLFYNPGDQSTALGYQNHQVHDLTSLVNEASATAHGTGSGKTQSGQPAAGPYNVPNFPAMGRNPAQPQTGSLASSSGGSGSMVSGQNGGSGTPFSVSNNGGSASFSGTNQWRCDAHVVESCDTQCMDVDPKDGCPFCIPGCHPASGGTSGGQGSQSSGQSQGQGTAGSQSGSLSQNPGTLTGGTSQSGGLSQSPGMLSGGSSQSGSLGQNVGLLSGTAGQSGTGLGGTLIQQPSGLSGTGGNTQVTQGKQGTSGPAVTTSGTNKAACPHFPSNCPKVYTAVDKNGCLVCTILSQFSQTTAIPVPTSTVQPTPKTCAPKRCVPPCDKGVVLDSYGCPQCLCPAHV